MSKSQPSQEAQSSANNARTIIFMVVLSFVCALILSILASVLAKPKEIARDLDRNKQMMIAAKIMDHEGHFLVHSEDGQYLIARYTDKRVLVADSNAPLATQQHILNIFKKRLIPMLVDEKGNLSSFQEAGIKEEEYLKNFKKTGYYKQPQKLLYKIMPNLANAQAETQPEGYVIPINGFGLWDAIYGYLAIAPNGNNVIGVTWYDQKETPGLGANISEAYWQNLFPGKRIFQAGPTGKTDFQTAPIGILVVKGKVSEVLGNSPKAQSAVDGMAGATLTGNGVTDAYRDVLNAYRPFLIKLHNENAIEKI